MNSKFVLNNFLSTLNNDVFIVTLFCLPQYVKSYHDKRLKCPQRKFTVKSCDCRCYMDRSRQKTNDKDKFQFSISEYKCNALF